MYINLTIVNHFIKNYFLSYQCFRKVHRAHQLCPAGLQGQAFWAGAHFILDGGFLRKRPFTKSFTHIWIHWHYESSSNSHGQILTTLRTPNTQTCAHIQQKSKNGVDRVHDFNGDYRMSHHHLILIIKIILIMIIIIIKVIIIFDNNVDHNSIYYINIKNIKIIFYDNNIGILIKIIKNYKSKNSMTQLPTPLCP